MNAGYTPTTEQVRSAWSVGHGDEAPAEFDRWLAAHDRAVAEKAWDEGWMQGSIHGDIHEQAGCSNPYTDADDVSVVERVCERLVAEEQAATIARVRALVTGGEQREATSLTRMFDGDPFPALFTPADIRAALDGAQP